MHKLTLRVHFIIFLLLVCTIIGLALIAVLLFLKKHTVQLESSPLEQFTQSRFAPYAYEILPEQSQAQEALLALTYFEIQKQSRMHNMIEVKIRPRGHYAWKTFILKRGYALYLAIMPDAEGEFNDTSTLDYINYDIPVLVDNNGYIIK